MAYGVYDTYSVDERWLDGGPPWGKTKKQVAEDTKRFADEAKAQDLNLTFSSHRYGEGSMSPDEAIAKILKAKTKKDLMGYDKDLPYFYTLATQEPGFFNFLSERKPLDYDNHPLYKESSIKTANNLIKLLVKQAAPPVDPVDTELEVQGTWNKANKNKKIAIKFPYSPNDFYETMSEDEFHEKLFATTDAINKGLMKAKITSEHQAELHPALLLQFMQRIK